MSRGKPRAVNLDLARANECGRSRDQFHAIASQGFRAIDFSGQFLRTEHVAANGGEVDDTRGWDSEFARATRGMNQCRGFEERFGGHAAGVQAIAPCPIAFNQRHSPPSCREQSRDRDAARAGSDGDEIEIGIDWPSIALLHPGTS
jgi:hypothetical protein